MENETRSRIFVIGSTRITEDASMQGKSINEIQSLLKHAYPQVENATTRERTDEETGATIVEFIPRPGRKG